ncbi:C69 family dipeptidase [Weissella confusa]|uniref:Dipeptidase n=1 Tax=Limosilactobacillus reuteri TaxID=1598 RepID=A0A2T5Q3T6_LIMRT|nr:C69 family dipeptidase [Limosilactobacillus reuteri]MCW3763765.1 C69 family dipeptidase [Weissella confusa]PTV04062.1 dipeptidase [Limosilactobacillus reuteri]
MKKNLSACTTVLVGRNATIDGSTMAARNDDTFAPLTPQRFVTYPAYHNHPNQVKAYLNKCVINRPADGYRYQGTPNVDYKTEGVFDESGFNEKNVGMSATESVYANARVLACDPLNTETGINEDLIVAATLPFIDSARDGVAYLGKLIAKYGSAEGNGVIFSDKDDVWYMEIVTGHHWVAQRIPDDAYAVTGNRIAIQQVDFNDKANFMWSDGIQEFVSKNHLNPDKYEWNFRHIFGTADIFDQHYNTPRQWYGHKVLNPETEFDPLDFDIPFIMQTDHRITLEDVEKILSSHYQGTPYDPLGHEGTDQQKHMFRPISLNRTQNSHVLQVRNDLPEAASTIMWMSFGIPTFTPYVPFFGNAEDIDVSYRETPEKLNMDLKSAYWMYRALSMIVESHHAEFSKADLDYLKDTREYLYRWVNEVAPQVKGMSSSEVSAFLSSKTHEMVAEMAKRTKALMAELVMNGLELSKLTFQIDKNL